MSEARATSVLSRGCLTAVAAAWLASCAPTEGPVTVGPDDKPAARWISPETRRPIEVGAGERIPPALAPVVQKGTGVFVKPAPGLPGGAAAGEDGITLNFAAADIRDVLRAVIGETLSENLVIDPRVQGTVTIQTSRPLAREQLIPVLEEVLRMNGAALVRREGRWEAIPLEGAPPTLVGGRRAEAGYGIRVVPLEHVSAAQLEGVLETFTASGVQVAVDATRNVLLLSGPGVETANLVGLIETFDVDWMEGMSFALIPLRVARAGELVGELETIFGDPQGPMGGLARFIPINRLNAVLVITPRPGIVDKAQFWISQLDRAGDTEERRIFIYYVQNGDAEDLARVLSEAFGTEAGAAAVPVVAPGLDSIELGVVVDAPRDAGGGPEAPAAAGMGAGTPAAEAPAAPAQTTQRLPGATRAAPLRAGEEARRPTARDRMRELAGELRFIADPRTNSLVIIATPREYEMIVSAIERLDIVPLQVMLEATIAEVTLTDDLRYGLQWFFETGNSQITLSQAATGAVAPIFPGFSYLFVHDDIRAVLNALESITELEVISAPKLMVLDNQPARLQVGDEVPVPVQQAVSVIDPDAPIVNTVEFRDTGVILEVLPRVNAGGLVIMDVRQEVSDVVETVTSGIDAPTIQQRVIESTVAVQSGETIALGGLIRNSNSQSKSGVPFLARIPIIGALFGNIRNDGARTELLVLLTPRVIGSTQDARDITEEFRRKMKGLRALGGEFDE